MYYDSNYSAYPPYLHQPCVAYTDVGEGREQEAETLEMLIDTCKLGFGFQRRPISSILGVVYEMLILKE